MNDLSTVKIRHPKPSDFTLETDHKLLEHAVETATDFLAIDELIADYEEHANNEQ